MPRHVLSRWFSREVSRPRYCPRLEALEGRYAPTVTTFFLARTGQLSIIGDAGDNDITVRESSGTHGTYSVAATDGVNGETAFTGVKSIAVNAQGQASAAGDRVTLVGNSNANSFLTGALSITGAGGLDVEFQSDFNVAGAVGISKTTNVGDLVVQTAAGGTVLDVTLGATTISNTGTGATTIDLEGTRANDVGITGALAVSTGAGASTLTLFQVAVAGGVTASGAAASQTFIFQNTTVGGFVSLNGTAANSGVDVTVLSTEVGVFFSVASGGGNDTVTVRGTSVLGLGLLPQQQTFGVNLRGGTNTSNIGSSVASAENVIHGSLFHFGAGTETFNLQNYTITSFVTVNAQAGNTGLTANISDSNLSGFLSCAAAGTVNDNVTVDNLSIGQNFALDLGGGTNTTTVTNNHYLGSYSEIDAGFDMITFTGNTGFGDVTFTAGRLFISNDRFIDDRIAGSGSFTSTANTNDDGVLLGASFGAAPTAGNAVSFGKALTINVGSSTGLDVVLINNVSVQADLTIAATVVPGLTAFHITNTTVGGNLTINAGTSTAAVPITLGTTASPNTGAVVVLGDLSITTGSGDDTLSLTDVSVGRTTALTTNAGGDTVNLEASANTLPGPSQFFGAVTVSTGDNADTINVGFSTDPARFYAAVTFDGGAGTDTLTETAREYYGGPPTRVGIP
jgi:filamentous hemagglutinin